MKRKISAIIVLLLICTTLACTIPINFATAPEVEEKIVYVEITSTPEPEEEETVVTEQTSQEEDEMASINMDGLWTIWQGPSEQKLSIDFLQKGNDLIGNAATDDGHSLLIVGVVSANEGEVSGTWESTDGTSGNFQITLNDSLNSFSGNMGGGVPLCGTRMGSSKPYPCMQ